jgi:predicted nucleic acid-binding protein
MNQGGGHSTKPTDEESVFCDTGILINYMNLEWERDLTSKLLEDHSGDVVISESVVEEFSSIIDRRADI